MSSPNPKLSLSLLVCAQAAGCVVGNEDGYQLDTIEITNGSLDTANRYANVGALMRPIEGGWWVSCSGTLVAPTVFLTAAHCATDGDTRWVSFEPIITADSVVYRGTYRVDPLYAGKVYDTHDFAVVVIDQPVTGITPARLPRAGFLDVKNANSELEDTPFRAVGYGVYGRDNSGGPPEFPFDDKRRFSTSLFSTMNKSWIHLSQKVNQDAGGTCFGDSGGPNFYKGSATIASTTIGGDMVCGSTNVGLRLDTPAARTFLARYVALP